MSVELGYIVTFGDYAVSAEAILTKELFPNLADAVGTTGVGGGPLGMTIKLGISAINKPKNFSEDLDEERHNFIREQDEATRP